MPDQLHAQGAPTGDLKNEDHEQLQLVTFQVADEEFAVSILQVQEINRMLPITRVPHSPPCVEGVINLRGHIIPVIDLRKRFGLDVIERGSQSRIIVVEVDTRVIGFVVDQVREVLRIQDTIVEPPPSITSQVDVAYIEGVAKLEDRLLILLNLSQLLDAEELRQVGTLSKDSTAQAA